MPYNFLILILDFQQSAGFRIVQFLVSPSTLSSICAHQGPRVAYAVKVFCAIELFTLYFDAVQTMEEESNPPDKQDPISTSAISLAETASNNLDIFFALADTGGKFVIEYHRFICCDRMCSISRADRFFRPLKSRVAKLPAGN